MTDTQNDRTLLFEQFIDLYYPSIFAATRKLTAEPDEKELEILTVKIFVDLWQNNESLFNKERPPAYVYKTILTHVFAHLRKKGDNAQLEHLQNTILIDPSQIPQIDDPIF